MKTRMVLLCTLILGVAVAVATWTSIQDATATPLPAHDLSWCQVETADDTTVMVRPSDCATWVLVCPTTVRSCYWDPIEMGGG